MRILVTGSEGNIGSILVPYLRKKGHYVFSLDIRQKFAENYLTADICSGVDLVRAFSDFQPEIVYHMAAMVSRVTSEASPSLTMKTNIYGTENIVQLCKAYGARMIFFSTSEVYGNQEGILREEDDPHPNNIYGLSKWLGEQLIRYEVSNGLNALIVRPFMFYHEDETFGQHRSAMIRFVRDLLSGETVTAHKDSARTWLHLDDGVKILEILAHSSGFQTVNIGHPEAIYSEALAEMICCKIGRDPRELVLVEDLPQRMTLTKYPDLSVQERMTGYYPRIGIEEGVERMIEKVKSRL